MSWFKRSKKSIEQSTPPDERRVKTEGLWTKCTGCRAIVWKKDLEANAHVCAKCQHHFRLNARQRLELLLDGRWIEHDTQIASNDPLHFVDTRPYAERLKEARRKLGMSDAVLTAEGLLAGRPVICCSMEFAFIGGSMGAAVGEKVTRAIERCVERKMPLVIIWRNSMKSAFRSFLCSPTRPPAA
jgi:acetyl-CoA carboxylase carboxyl transferase subunit beta